MPPKKRSAAAPTPYERNAPPAIHVSDAASEKKSVCHSIFPADQKIKRRMPTAQTQEKHTTARSRRSRSRCASIPSAVSM